MSPGTEHLRATAAPIPDPAPSTTMDAMRDYLALAAFAACLAARGFSLRLPWLWYSLL